MVDNEPMRALRHHVTGAIERGEGHPIVAHEISETGTPYLPDGYDGPVALCSDCGNNAPAAPVKRVRQVRRRCHRGHGVGRCATSCTRISVTRWAWHRRRRTTCRLDSPVIHDMRSWVAEWSR